MNSAVRLMTSALVLVSLSCSVAKADWPAFRGLNGGLADAQDLPEKLTKDNILWKAKLPGPGTSSPITTSNKIFLTCYTGYGSKITKGFGVGGFGKGGFGGKGSPDTGGDQKKLRLVVLCLDQKNGDVLWQKEIKPKLPEKPFTSFLREHGYASSTPVTDGENVYVFFGKSGVFAFDMEGKQLWQADVGTGTHIWGSAASPILYRDLVIVNAAIESGALVALDKKTGKEVWRTKGIGTSWSTPVLVETGEGKTELVVSEPGKVVGSNPETGEKLWYCDGIGKAGGKGGFGGGGFGGGGFGSGMGGSYTISTPVTRDGIVYVIGGGGTTPAAALAVKAGGKGDVNKTHVLWRKKAGTSTASPLLNGDHLVWVAGIATALNLADGSTAYNERLYGSKGEYVSAVAAGNTIYALTRFDGLYVLGGGGKLKRIAHLEFPGDDSIFNSSPAISNSRLFVRSNAYLYCLGNQSEN